MSLSVKWEEKLFHKELQSKAYARARKIHDSFNKITYGSSSYFHSFAERLPEFIQDGLEKVKGKIEEESNRGSVASYWSKSDEEGVTLHTKISGLFQKEIPADLRALMRNYQLDVGENSPEYKEYFHQHSAYVFNFLADFIVLEEKKNDTDSK